VSGRWSRDKRACIKRAVVRRPQAEGPKCRDAGICQLYDWLDQSVVLIANEDQHLVVLRVSLAAEVASWGTKGGAG
jgi:hypothetical protein